MLRPVLRLQQTIALLHRAAITLVVLHFVALGAAWSLVAQQQPSNPAAPPTLIRDARVFDGARVLERRDVLVEDGRIARVGRRLRAPAGATVIEARGMTLLPGLIDAHTHTFGDALREALVFGVTTHLDMFTDHRFAGAMRAEQRAGGAAGRADLFASGTLVTAPGGHGTQFGMQIPTLTSAADAEVFVDERITEGSDWIKIVFDDGHAFGGRIPTIDRASMRATIEAAHRRGKLAVVHVSDLASARAAVEDGADGLVHVFMDREADAEFARLAARRGVFVIPTLTVIASVADGRGGGAGLVADPRLAPYLAPGTRTQLEQGFPRRQGAPALRMETAAATVNRLRSVGVRILAGTDTPNPGTAPGSAMHRELELLVGAGLTPVEALAAATRLPAEAFRLADRGRIAPGLRADLLLVDGDPTRDITATRAIAGVWKGGVRLDREPWAREVAAALAVRRDGPADLVDGLVSDFEGGGLQAAIGSWMPSADDFAGGTSTGTVRVVEGGARGGHAMEVAGTITNAVPFAWYGAMWSPGAQPMMPVDLSASRGLAFQARGDGGTYRVMLFARSRGMTPLERTFEAGPEWREVSLAWSDFGVDGSDVMGVVIAAGPRPGRFVFRIDEFRLR
jgi:imidazolonepropionase-like amidohydrolase